MIFFVWMAICIFCGLCLGQCHHFGPVGSVMAAYVIGTVQSHIYWTIIAKK